jgi:hypothetical protein
MSDQNQNAMCVRAGCFHGRGFHLDNTVSRIEYGKCNHPGCKCEQLLLSRETMPSDSLREQITEDGKRNLRELMDQFPAHAYSKFIQGSWLIEEIVPGSRWKHRNGNLYTVLLIANTASTNPDYEPTVVYQGENGNVWARLLSDWSRSFEAVSE